MLKLEDFKAVKIEVTQKLSGGKCYSRHKDTGSTYDVIEEGDCTGIVKEHVVPHKSRDLEGFIE